MLPAILLSALAMTVIVGVRVHHANRPPTAWAAMAFTRSKRSPGCDNFATVFAIPFHVGALGVVLGIITLMGVSNHMGQEIFPRFM